MFKKGKSGNPNGRRVEKLSDKLAQQYGPDAIQIIQELMRTSKSPKIRLDAAKYLADRAYGKAPQAVQLSGEEGGPIRVAVINSDV